MSLGVKEDNFLDVGDIIEDIATGGRALVIGAQGGTMVLWISPEAVVQTPPHPDDKYIEDFFKSYEIVGHVEDLEWKITMLKYEDGLPPDIIPS